MSLAVALVVAALSGFIALSYEILWFRALSYATGSAPWVFGALLGAYLGGVAIASHWARGLCSRHPRPGPREVRLVAGFALVANAAGFLVVPALASLAEHGAWPAGLALLAVSSGLLGAVLPLAAHLAIPPDDRAGARLSYVYAADIVGSALGSAVTGYVLLDVATLVTISTCLAAGGAVMGGGLWWRGSGARPSRLAGPGLAALSIALAVASAPRLFDRLWERLQFGPRSAGMRFAEVVENRHGVIAVTEGGAVYGGGAYDGAFSTDLVRDPNGIWRAYDVLGLHPAPRDVLVVGLGSGSWARVLQALPGVERLTLVEINPGYLQLIRERSGFAELLTDPRVEVVVDDGRRWLARNPGRTFDVIVANLTLHWRAHATNLLSTEFVQLIKDHLAPGGVYYFNSTGSQGAADTARAAFASGLQLDHFIAVSDRPLRFDADRVRTIVPTLRLSGRPVLDVSDPAQRARLEWVATAPRDRPAPRPGARLVTDDNMATEWHLPLR